jgi:hypothetical protein
MYKNKILILILLTLHLAISLKTNNFCMIKQQVCNGFYDENQNYEIKCDSIKCHGSFNYTCGFNICSNKKSGCNEINKLNSDLKFMLKTKYIDLLANPNNLIEIKKIKSIYKEIKNCSIKDYYKLRANDFCIRAKNCKTILGYGNLKLAKRIECKCPLKQAFRCDKYCTIDSIACDHSKLKESKKNLAYTKLCVNHNSTEHVRFFSTI